MAKVFRAKAADALKKHARLMQNATTWDDFVGDIAAIGGIMGWLFIQKRPARPPPGHVYSRL